MERIVVTQIAIGICYMQVCAVPDATDEEILYVCNTENPSGTSNGWSIVFRNDEDERLNPVHCADYPERIHFLVGC